MTRQAGRQDSFAKRAQLRGDDIRLSQRSLCLNQQTNLSAVPSVVMQSNELNLMKVSADSKKSPAFADEVLFRTDNEQSGQPLGLNAFDCAKPDEYLSVNKDLLYGISTTKNRSDEEALLRRRKKGPPPKPAPHLPSTSRLKPPPPSTIMPIPTRVEYEFDNHTELPHTPSPPSGDWNHLDIASPQFVPRAAREDSHHQEPRQRNMVTSPLTVPETYQHERRYEPQRHVQAQFRSVTTHRQQDCTAQHVEYTPKHVHWEYSPQPLQPSLPCHPQARRKSAYQPKAWIEISRGVDVPLRGAEETWECVQNDFYIPVNCFCCSTELCCIQDADYVLCPLCRVISPLANTGDCSCQGHIGGVGLGFTLDDLFRWQMELLTARR